MKKTTLLFALAVLASIVHAGESKVRMGTNTTVLVEHTNQYFRILVPAKWTLSVQTNDNYLPSFPLHDETNGPIFTVEVSPKDAPAKCGCAFPGAVRHLYDSNGNRSVDFFWRPGDMHGLIKGHCRVHKEYGRKYFVDIHVDAGAPYHGDPKVIIDAVIDSLEVK